MTVEIPEVSPDDAESIRQIVVNRIGKFYGRGAAKLIRRHPDGQQRLSDIVAEYTLTRAEEKLIEQKRSQIRGARASLDEANDKLEITIGRAEIDARSSSTKHWQEKIGELNEERGKNIKEITRLEALLEKSDAEILRLAQQDLEEEARRKVAGNVEAQSLAEANAQLQKSTTDPRIVNAVLQLKAALPGVTDDHLDNALKQLLATEQNIAEILTGPVADGGEQGALANFHPPSGNIGTATEVLRAMKAAGFPSGPLSEAMVWLVERGIESGYGGMGARLRAACPRGVLAANSAGFNVEHHAVRMFIASVINGWIGATSESVSAGISQEVTTANVGSTLTGFIDPNATSGYENTRPVNESLEKARDQHHKRNI